MKVAAYQASLLQTQGFAALELIRARIAECEAKGVAILCCPEAVLGGLADYAEDPTRFALRVDTGQLASVLAPLASETVTTIVGFTEITGEGLLYNSAAVLHRGSVIGVYRKLHPAINRSVYHAGTELPVFRVGSLTFGIILCNDSNFAEPARGLASGGATVLFVPTNNGLPHSRATEKLVAAARRADVTLATENRLWIVRADVAGANDAVLSHGSSAITDPTGNLVCAGQSLGEDILVAEIPVKSWPDGSIRK